MPVGFLERSDLFVGAYMYDNPTLNEGAVFGFNGSATGTYEFNATVVGTGCPAMDPPSMTSNGPNLGCTSNDCL